MMFNFAQWMTTLAAGWEGLIYVIIFLVISISQYLAKKKEEQEEQQASQGRPSEPRGEQPASSTSQRLQEIARQRQLQLQRLAERQLEKQQRQKQPRQPQATPRPQSPAHSKIQREALPSQTKRVEADTRQRQSQSSPQRLVQSMSAALPSQQPRAQRLPKPATSTKQKRQPQSSPEAHGLNVKMPSIKKRSHAESTKRSAELPAMQLNLDRQSLRQAIILKEVLDKPLALRQPGESHLNW